MLWRLQFARLKLLTTFSCDLVSFSMYNWQLLPMSTNFTQQWLIETLNTSWVSWIYLVPLYNNSANTNKRILYLQPNLKFSIYISKDILGSVNIHRYRPNSLVTINHINIQKLILLLIYRLLLTKITITITLYIIHI